MLDLTNWSNVHTACKSLVFVFSVFIVLSIAIPQHRGMSIFECSSFRPHFLRLVVPETPQPTDGLGRVERDIIVVHDILTTSQQCSHVLILITSRVFSLILILATWCSFLSRTGSAKTLPYPLYSFFTIWTLFLLTVYFTLITLYHTYRLLCHKPMISTFWDVYRFAVFFLFQSQMTSNFLVTVGFWGLTYPLLPEKTQALMWSWSFLMMHGGTLLLLLLEFYLSNLYVAGKMIFVSTVMTFTYVIFSIHNYGMLPSLPVDVKRMETALLMMGIFVSLISTHVMLSRVSRHKRREKKGDNTFVISNLPLSRSMVRAEPPNTMNIIYTKYNLFGFIGNTHNSILSHLHISNENMNVAASAYLAEGDNFYLLVKSCQFSNRRA